MRVATFRLHTAWVGRGIEYDRGQFLLEGHGPVPPQALLDYDSRGEIDWAYAGLREWVQSLVARAGAQAGAPWMGAGQVVTAGPVRPAAQGAARRPGVPGWVIALIVLGVVVVVVPVVAAITIPMFMMAGARSGAPTAVQTPVKMPVVTSGGYWIRLDSDHGDYVGGGRSYTFTPANSQVTVRASGNHLAIIVLEAKGPYGRNSWNGDFQEPSSLPELAKGTYTDLRRYPFNDPAKGGLDWSGEGRGSNELTGWFAIDKVSYKGGRLSAITLRFELHSEGGAPALHGEIEWVR